MAKTYADTYLYTKYPEYEKKLFKFIMSGTEIDKNSDDFEDIRYEVKRRQIDNCLLKILMSDKIKLILSDMPMGKQFKVFCAYDIKSSSKKPNKLVYIDCSNIITRSDVGKYICPKPDILISYLVSAMVTYIYYIDDRRFTNNGVVLQSGSKAFAQLMTHIVDYVCKISSMGNTKNKCLYICSLYYYTNILGLTLTEGHENTARRNSSLSEREADIVKLQLKDGWNTNIKFLAETLSEVLKLNKLTLDVIIERWMYIYGVGTVFGTEIFPAFASMITDAYVGAYINNQKTIEKITGVQMTEFTKAVLRVGGDSV